MIYDTLDHIQQYEGILPGVMKGLHLLADTDFSAWEDGRHAIDGDDLFILLQSYDTKPVNDTPEAHKKYIDIQYLLSGEERIAVAPVAEMDEEVEARPESDIWFYRGKTDDILLTGKRFLVLFPQDAHAPCIAVHGTPAPCRKCVVKVRVG